MMWNGFNWVRFELVWTEVDIGWAQCHLSMSSWMIIWQELVNILQWMRNVNNEMIKVGNARTSKWANVNSGYGSRSLCLLLSWFMRLITCLLFLVNWLQDYKVGLFGLLYTTFDALQLGGMIF